MKVSDIIRTLEEWAPKQHQESYDNSGLICGDPESTITSVLCSLDCTEEVVKEAANKGCEMIIAHHPIVFAGMKSLTGQNYVERTVIAAIQKGIAIYAIHTNLDHAWTGVNRKIGERLDLQNLQVLSPKTDALLKLDTFVPHAALEDVKTALFNAGAGHIGEYDHCSFSSEGQGTFRGSINSTPTVGQAGEDHREAESKLEVILPFHLKSKLVKALLTAHPYEEVAYDLIALQNEHQQLGSGMIGRLSTPQSEKSFFEHVAERFKLKVIRHTALLGKPIETVAFCGGAGRFLLPNAIAQKADVFITSDFKYHEFFDAEQKLVIMDIGHFESEQFTPELIKEYLEEKIPTFAVLLSEAGTNPVHYYIS
ncbi:MAG: Nif3-like dinuclear metal center hexameric protein [Flavobacteriales bacterium]|nr:Nif3-like dinuclear metal center hexameric protein [Flavobacteriales bacterium]